MGRDWVDLLWSSIDSMKKTLIIIIVIFLLIILVTLLGGGVLYILAIPPMMVYGNVMIRILGLMQLMGFTEKWSI